MSSERGSSSCGSSLKYFNRHFEPTFEENGGRPRKKRKLFDEEFPEEVTANFIRKKQKKAVSSQQPLLPEPQPTVSLTTTTTTTSSTSNLPKLFMFSIQRELKLHKDHFCLKQIIDDTGFATLIGNRRRAKKVYRIFNQYGVKVRVE